VTVSLSLWWFVSRTTFPFANRRAGTLMTLLHSPQCFADVFHQG
jgi:hypothetical protein